MRVLFLSPTLPWPLTSGGAIRTWQLLRALRGKVEVHLWAVRQPEFPGDSLARVAEICRELRVFERSPLPLLHRLAAPGPERWFHSAARNAALSRLPRGSFDVVHVDELCLARALPRSSDVPHYLHHHKLDLELSRALVAVGRGSSLEVERWRALEGEVAHRFDHHVFCGTEDAERFQARHPSISVSVVENGVDLDVFSPAGDEREPRHLIFLGSLDYPPNLDGIGWFLRDSWPRVHRAFPDLRLSLVGRSPGAELRRPLPDGVELVGPVDEVRSWLARATALVVPLRIGGGTRLKINEALAVECPVITTEVGVEGLDLLDGEHLYAAESSTDLAAAIESLLRDPEEAERRTRAGRKLVVERYGWKHLAGKLERIWRGE